MITWLRDLDTGSRALALVFLVPLALWGALVAGLTLWGLVSLLHGLLGMMGDWLLGTAVVILALKLAAPDAH